MNKKGFTLIELLAVIVILAIIALIATPIVLSIIEESRENAKVSSAQFILGGVETAYAVAYTKTYADDEDTEGVDESKNSGEVPSIANIKDELNFKNATAAIDEETGALVITSTDEVVCTFNVPTTEEVTAGKKANTLYSDDCGLEGKIEAVEIGTVKVASAG